MLDFNKPVSMTASARLIYQLGEQLISDELVALSELIKNSYDADALRVKVIVDSKIETDYGRGQIIIEDNGNGMTPSIIVNSFLKLSGNFKVINKISPHFKRRTLGEKGLGRLSFQRLGCYIEVLTSPRVERFDIIDESDIEYLFNQGMNTYSIKLDWREFSDDKNFEDVTAEVLPLKKETPIYGTRIIISGIRNLNFWDLNVGQEKRLRNDILSMTNPFVSSDTTDFINIDINIDGKEFLVDSIDENIVREISDVYVKFQMENGVLDIKLYNQKKYFERLKEDYIKRFTLDDKGPCYKLIEDNCSYNNYKYFHETVNFNEDQEKFSFVLNKVNGKNALDFSFTGAIYTLDRGSARNTKITKNLLDQSLFIQKNFFKVGELWDSIYGIFMFRDKFRILPYGKKDWLGFTQLSQRSKATIFKEGNVSGYITINGESSEYLKEQTNRQGILEDEYGYNFMKILSTTLIETLIKWDAYKLRKCFIQPVVDKKSGNDNFLYNSTREITFERVVVIKDAVEQSANDLVNEIEKTNNDEQISLFSDNAKQLANKALAFKQNSEQIIRKYEQDIYMKDTTINEYEQIVPLIGQSILVESATHEFTRIFSNLSTVNKQLQIFSKDNKELLNDKSFKLNKMILYLSRQINDLNLQLNHILPTQKNKIKNTEDINIRDFLKSNYDDESIMKSKLDRKNIKILFHGDDFKIRSSLGVLIVVFDNLVLNSMYWIENISNPIININIDKHGIVTYWDNGRGIDKSIEDTLFNPFVTLKSDGRGLGLYICQELLAVNSASINLLDDINEHGRKYKFQIIFNEVI
jgi:signal transduction histidine kinase